MLQRFHPAEDYAIDVPLALLRQAEATQRTFSIVLGSIAGIGLLVGGIGIGIIFGLYPAARAAALDPITALRHE